MKTYPINHFLRILLAVFCLSTALPARAQEANDLFSVSGIVRDSQSGRPVSGASVSIPGTRIGTVTNADGTFSIKIKRDLGAQDLEFSHLGYTVLSLPVTGRDLDGITVRLSIGAIALPVVTVVNIEARALVDEAVRRIDSNYSDRANLLTGFYRETVQKRGNYVDIAEAVVEIYRSSYSNIYHNDRLRIVKGRRLVSPRARDTVAVKLQGGPNIYLSGDIVMNHDLLLAPDMLDYYRFTIESPVVINDRPHHTVFFEPGVIHSEYALYTGRLYIDRESLTISRAEYAFDMANRDKVTASILRRKLPLCVSILRKYRSCSVTDNGTDAAISTIRAFSSNSAAIGAGGFSQRTTRYLRRW